MLLKQVKIKNICSNPRGTSRPPMGTGSISWPQPCHGKGHTAKGPSLRSETLFCFEIGDLCSWTWCWGLVLALLCSLLGFEPYRKLAKCKSRWLTSWWYWFQELLCQLSGKVSSHWGSSIMQATRDRLMQMPQILSATTPSQPKCGNGFFFSQAATGPCFPGLATGTGSEVANASNASTDVKTGTS
jgi:hypothetical protein